MGIRDEQYLGWPAGPVSALTGKSTPSARVTSCTPRPMPGCRPTKRPASDRPTQNGQFRADRSNHHVLTSSAQNGGSACSYQEPFALWRQSRLPHPAAGGQPYVYASARFGRPSSFALRAVLAPMLTHDRVGHATAEVGRAHSNDFNE